MNLSSINTVDQLLEANKQEPVDQTKNLKDLVLESVLELDADQALDVAKSILDKLALWHQATAKELAESGDHERSHLWAADEGRIHAAMLILDEVEL